MTVCCATRGKHTQYYSNNDRPGARPAGPPYTDRSIGGLERRCDGDPKFGS
ncbi:hypothetical protein ASPBRDRAFT_139796 [Aspergillus brasiliensis CBS 101740]|uniref:Uncharacterized protein n=1 Tax=Aspergillus brasiliensis (strain CBS 101740 / IMI 381727 / IBT 21946) TaxID=767769 RepID=A0A1L9U1N9_ASPBC|nr:hypothetical protein ASPBRDRAFT_139796 [Aspergillus brasiliensis CBS 101740]